MSGQLKEQREERIEAYSSLSNCPNTGRGLFITLPLKGKNLHDRQAMSFLVFSSNMTL
jgi:hypothetical protein